MRLGPWTRVGPISPRNRRPGVEWPLAGNSSNGNRQCPDDVQDNGKVIIPVLYDLEGFQEVMQSPSAFLEVLTPLCAPP